ncbi:hypothetical protein ABT297_26345 [Dactylosporangium sp. NPDC000555]|uniref:hypothetical protein n=1 Tax=Dactylosporangium sp. NPDC000555 TaxID=3154260 RepID=UPI00332936D7
MTNRIRPRPGARGAVRTAGRSPLPRWIYPALAVALAVGLAVGALIGAATADPRTEQQKRIDAMQAADVQRDADQVVALTDQARRVRDLLGSTLDGLLTALPPGAAPGPPATAAQAEGWKAATRQAAGEFANPPSAGTAVNVARGGLAAGARQLDLAVDTYAAALKAGDDLRPALLGLASRQRDSAIASWSIGATQLDQLSVDTGHGHQHVFLPHAPGQGAMTADGEREGG